MPPALAGLGHDELVTVVRERLLAGHLIDRAGIPQLIGAHGIDAMREVAIDEWLGASPIYTRRMQALLGFGRGDVETICKGLQLDVGSPPQFMDFRFRVDGPDRAEFWLDHCGALLDVEPMGEEFVVTMCHAIEDPTFDGTAWATDPRARMRPVHRPPRTPADRHPHCHWTITIDPADDPLPEPTPTARIASSLAAALPLPAIEPGGRTDYVGPLEDDLDLASFADAALAAIAEEVALQGQLLAISFAAAVEERYGAASARAVGRRQLTGVGGVAAARLTRALGLGDAWGDVATVLALHPAFGPSAYVDWRVEADADGVTMALHPCPALGEAERGLHAWPGLLVEDGQAPLDAIVRGVDPRLAVEPASASGGAVAAWRVRRDPDPHPVAAEVTLTELSGGAAFAFEER